MSTLLVVDGHNLVNDAGRILTSASTGVTDEVAHAYFRDWFDVDRLVEATTGGHLDNGEHLGIVVFHSRKSIGKGLYRFESEAAREFWARQGSNRHTSTLLVDVDGAPSGKDVGVDTAIVVYMFETMARWDSVVLFTNDADFVPAVWSLRRQGKQVYCASHAEHERSPLVQACQSFLPWDVDFLEADRSLFSLLQPGGVLDQFLQRPEIASRTPRLSTRRDQIIVTTDTGGFDRDSSHALNGRIASLGFHAEFAGAELRIWIHKDNRVMARAINVIRGLERHRGLNELKKAEWHKRWER